jgi:excisionase family DNA binding protein
VLAPLKKRAARSVRLRVADARDEVVLPREAFELLLGVLGAMAEGNAVTLVPVHTELTTQQAADLLQVSRPHFVELLDGGRIPFRMVGTHRRVLARDVFAYRDEARAASERAMEELAAIAQKQGLGY